MSRGSERRLARGSLRALAMAVGPAVVACSLSGLTGGSASGEGGPSRQDSSSDAPRHHDAPTESAQAHDAVTHDAVRDTATQRDGGGDGDAHDLDASRDAAAKRDGATDAGLACEAATICDDFAARSAPSPEGDPRWQEELCDIDEGATMTVTGSLNVDQPAVDASTMCYLQSYRSSMLHHAVSLVGSFDLEFDLTYHGTSNGLVQVASVSVYKPDSDAMEQDDFELLIAGDATAQLLVLNSAMGFMSHQLASSGSSAWVALDKACHISFTGDVKTPSATATATCDGVSRGLSQVDASIPFGFAGDAVLNFGYGQFNPHASPARTLVYSNLLFEASP